MSAPGGQGDGRDTPVPVWVFAPVGRDAELLRAHMRREDGLRVAKDARHLASALAEPDEVGVLVMTQEALYADVIDVLSDHLRRQPPWAELPILLLVDPVGNTMAALGRFQEALPRTKVLVLQRPVRMSELETAVDALRRSRRRQYRVAEYVERQEVLRRELNHRVKNILATVQAVYGLTVRKAEDLNAFDGVFQPRLAAMARVHEVLFAGSYGEIDLDEVIRAVLAPYAGDERVALAGPSMKVSSEVAQNLALVLHELATNAAKYGALTSEAGRVALSWTWDEALTITWQEAGGPPVTAPDRRGYGVTFIEATMTSLGGEAVFDYAREGLRVAARMPLEALRARTEGKAG